MGISLTEATELTGKSKSTLNRAIKSGDLSAKRSEDGKTYEVEKSELERVYGALTMVNHGSPEAVNHDEPSEQQGSAGMQQALQAELLELRYEDSKKVHRREIELLQAQIDDLRKDRDDWKTQASNQTLLLKHEQEKSEKKSFSWFR